MVGKNNVCEGLEEAEAEILMLNFAYKCHMTDQFKSHGNTVKTDECLITGGQTSHLEPADVSWNKQFN